MKSQVRTALENLTVLSVTPLPEQSSQGQICRWLRCWRNPPKWTFWRRPIPEAACGCPCGTRSTQPRTGAAGSLARQCHSRRLRRRPRQTIVNRFESIPYSMILVSSLVFFLVIFLLPRLSTAIAYLAFLKMKADQSDAERSDVTLSKPLDDQPGPDPTTWKNLGVPDRTLALAAERPPLAASIPSGRELAFRF